MKWFNTVISDIQKRFVESDDFVIGEEAGVHALRERKNIEKIQQFQARLHDLDRRLSELR